jgi:hypothetical protein
MFLFLIFIFDIKMSQLNVIYMLRLNLSLAQQQNTCLDFEESKTISFCYLSDVQLRDEIL